MSKYSNKKYNKVYCDSDEIIVSKGKWRQVCHDDYDYGHHRDHKDDCKKVLICKEEKKHDKDHDHDDHCHKEKKCRPVILRVKRIKFYDDCHNPCDNVSCVPEDDITITLADAIVPSVPTPITAFPFSYRFQMPVVSNGDCNNANTLVDFFIDLFAVTYSGGGFPGASATIAVEVLSGAELIYREERTLIEGADPGSETTNFNIVFNRRVDLFQQITIRGVIVSQTGTGTVTVNPTASSVTMVVHGTNRRRRGGKFCNRRGNRFGYY